MITSLHNPRIKLIRALAGRPKERQDAGVFLAEGARLVEDAFLAGWPIRFVLYSTDASRRAQSLVDQLREAGVDVEEVSPPVLRSASETDTSQGLIAVLSFRESSQEFQTSLDFVIVPDQIRDPGNLGTIIRTAAAVGAQAVLIPPETTDAFAPKVVRAGMGAHFHIPVVKMGWDEIHLRVQQLAVFLADAAGDMPVWDADFRQPLALIIGGEADGASQPARDMTNMVINIPMPGKIESLNASVAGAVVMFEIIRQRREVI